MSLLDMIQQGDPAANRGLMELGLALMSGRGNFGQALGKAGSVGLNAADEYRMRQEALKRAALNDELLQSQVKAQKDAQAQQEFVQQLASRYYRTPAQAAMTQYGGPTVAAANAVPQTQGGFDQEGFINELTSKYPLLGLEMGQRFAKQGPQPMTVGEGGMLGYVRNGKWVPLVNNPKPEKSDKLPTKLQEYQAAYPNNEFPGGFGKWLEHMARAGSTNISNVLPKIELKTGEGLAGQVGPMLKESRDRAMSGVKLVDSAQRILDAAQTNQLYSGPLANVKLKAAQFGEVFGIAGKDTQQRIENTRAVIRALSEQAVAARSTLGSQAQISNAEQELLTKATSGDIGELTHREVVQISEINDRLGRQLYAQHQAQLGNLQGDQNLQGLAKFYAAPPILPPRTKGTNARSVLDEADAILRGR